LEIFLLWDLVSKLNARRLYLTSQLIVDVSAAEGCKIKSLHGFEASDLVEAHGHGLIECDQQLAARP
jgi:hypothetical protein